MAATTGWRQALWHHCQSPVITLSPANAAAAAVAAAGHLVTVLIERKQTDFSRVNGR